MRRISGRRQAASSLFLPQSAGQAFSPIVKAMEEVEGNSISPEHLVIARERAPGPGGRGATPVLRARSCSVMRRDEIRAICAVPPSTFLRIML